MGTETTPGAVGLVGHGVEDLGAEDISVEIDDLNDELMTEEQKSSKDRTNVSQDEDVETDGGGVLVFRKEVRVQKIIRSVMRSKKAGEPCVIDPFGCNMDALQLSTKISAQHIEFCSIEIFKCVTMVTASTDRVDSLEKGFPGQEAQFASKPSSSMGDNSKAENRIMSNVLSRVDEECKNDGRGGQAFLEKSRAFCNLRCKKMDLDMTALKERRGRDVRPVLLQLRRAAGAVEGSKLDYPWEWCMRRDHRFGFRTRLELKVGEIGMMFVVRPLEWMR